MADLDFTTNFTLTSRMALVVGDTYDPGFKPDQFRPWCDVTIEPYLIGSASTEIRITGQTPKITILLIPIPARIETGVLRLVRQPAPATETPTAEEREAQDDTEGVPLLAETPELELPDGTHLAYRVKFGPMKFGGATYRFEDFAFLAPTTAVTLDIASVERIDAPPSTPAELVVRMIPDDWDYVDGEGIAFYANGIQLGTRKEVAVTGVPADMDDITDAQPVGKAVTRSATQAAARGAIGAGTSSLSVDGTPVGSYDLDTTPVTAADVGAYTTEEVDDAILGITTGGTLTDPKINSIKDTNGNGALDISATASAVNRLRITNAAAGGSPSIVATGADANLSIDLTPKGSNPTVSIWTGSVAAARLLLSGSGADVGLNVAVKGSGQLQVNGNQVQTKSVVSLTSTATLSAVSGHEYVYLLGASAAPTLPTAVSNHCIYQLKNTTASPISVATTSSQTIDGMAGPLIVDPNDCYTLVSDNANWWIV